MPYAGERAFLLMNATKIKMIPTTVSMPYAGERAFLLKMNENDSTFEWACQCPMRANEHFYGSAGLHRGYLLCGVSMPYAGERAFLRYPL